MAFTDLGKARVASLFAGAGGNAFNNTNAHLGVGDSTAAFAASQTDLQAATNKMREPMDATYPQIAANVVTYRATFEAADANWVWQEWGLFDAVSAGLMASRKVESHGTKAATDEWQFTATMTF